jgi:glycine/D-amino acid oxidase-like deaminating enzyme
MRVAVIGAGIVGVCVARELAMGGADVTVLERRQVGAGTSSTTFAWINSHDKHPGAYHALNVAGCEEHVRLAGRGRSVRSYFRTGNLVWDDSPDGRDRLRHRVDRLRGLGYRCEWLDPDAARALQPGLRLPAGVAEVGSFPDEGHVLVDRLIGELVREARSHGAVVRESAEVRAIRPDSSGVDVVVENGAGGGAGGGGGGAGGGAGGVERFDRVVVCAGRDTQALVATFGGRAPLAPTTGPGRPTAGLLAQVSAPRHRLTRVLTTPRLNVRPNGDGRLLLQSLELDAALDPDQPPPVDGDVAAAMLERLASILDVPGPVSVEAFLVGHRVLPVDGLPIVGYADPDRRCYAVATHSGVTLGPLLGRLVTREIRDDEPVELLADYRPDRFDNGEPTVTVVPPRHPGQQ